MICPSAGQEDQNCHFLKPVSWQDREPEALNLRRKGGFLKKQF